VELGISNSLIDMDPYCGSPRTFGILGAVSMGSSPPSHIAGSPTRLHRTPLRQRPDSDGTVSPPMSESSPQLRSAFENAPQVVPPGVQVVQVDASDDVWGELERLLYGADNDKPTPPASPHVSSEYCTQDTYHGPAFLRLDGPDAQQCPTHSANWLAENGIQATLVADVKNAVAGSVLELTLEKNDSGEAAFSFVSHPQEDGAASAYAPLQSHGASKEKAKGGGKRRGFIIMCVLFFVLAD